MNTYKFKKYVWRQEKRNCREAGRQMVIVGMFVLFVSLLFLVLLRHTKENMIVSVVVAVVGFVFVICGTITGVLNREK